MDRLTNRWAADILKKALKEGHDLLEWAEFRLDEGLYLQGPATTLSVRAHPDIAETGIWTVRVTCHAAGHLAVDWTSLALILIDVKSEAVSQVNWLNERGSAVFRLAGSAETRFRIQPCVLSDQPDLQAVVLRGAGRDRVPEASNAEPPNIKQTSFNGPVQVSARRSTSNVVHIEFRTSDKTLRNARVYFDLFSAGAKSKPIVSDFVFLDRVHVENLSGNEVFWSDWEEQIKTLPNDLELRVSVFRSPQP